MCDTQEAIDSRLLELHKGATSQVSLLTEGTHSIPCAASSGNSEELLNSMSGDRPWSIEGGPDDPICIVGLGIVPDRKLIRQSLTFLACHLPGGVRSPSSLWDLLLAKRTAQGLVPPERFNIQGFHGLDDSRAGAMAADGGYFLEDDVRLFENSFFHINNIEATYSKHIYVFLRHQFTSLDDSNMTCYELRATYNVEFYTRIRKMDYIDSSN